MEIELYSKLNDPITAIKSLGTIFAKSGMFGCEKEEQGQVLAMICLSEHKSPVAITTNYDIVEGKLRKKALAALADFRSAGGKHKWIHSGDIPTTNADERYAELELTDKEGNKVVYRYSMADAKAEGLVRDKSRWTKRPGNMLRARCISNGLGMLCPEIFAGEEEELESPQPETKTLLREEKRAEAKPEPKAEPKPPENVIDVQTTVAPAPETKTEAPASSETAPKTYTESDIEISSDTQRLTTNAMAALESVIGEQNRIAAITWLKKHGWIQDTMSEISVDRARRIMRKPSEFIGHITKGGQ